MRAGDYDGVRRALRLRACADFGEDNDVAQAGCDAEPCPLYCCNALGRHTSAGAASGQTADVTRVIVRGNPLLSDRTDRPDISTGRESQVSVHHAVAAALVTGEAGLDQFTDACVRDPKVLALRSKVEVLRDSAFSTIAAAVEIFTADGNSRRLSQPAARGSDVNPMSDGDLEAKLRSAAAGWDPRYDVAPLVDAIWARSTKAPMFPDWLRWPCRRLELTKGTLNKPEVN